jgi:hypothetical protein
MENIYTFQRNHRRKRERKGAILSISYACETTILADVYANHHVNIIFLETVNIT